MEQVERAIDYIGRSGSARTPELATLLHLSPADVDALLAKPREQGLLITCDVQVGEQRITEYRCSTAPGSKSTSRLFAPLKPKTAAGLASAELRRRQPDGPVAPVPAAAPQEEKMLTARDLITATLREHGRSTLDELAKRTKLEKDAISTTLWSMKGVRRVARGTYELGKGKAAPPQSSKPRQPKKGRGHRVSRPAPVGRNGRKAERVPSPAGPATNGKGAAFAINEYGEIGIHRGDEVMKLDAAEFARLREFIERTEPVWQGAR